MLIFRQPLGPSEFGFIFSWVQGWYFPPTSEKTSVSICRPPTEWRESGAIWRLVGEKMQTWLRGSPRQTTAWTKGEHTGFQNLQCCVSFDAPYQEQVKHFWRQACTPVLLFTALVHINPASHLYSPSRQVAYWNLSRHWICFVAFPTETRNLGSKEMETVCCSKMWLGCARPGWGWGGAT